MKSLLAELNMRYFNSANGFYSNKIIIRKTKCSPEFKRNDHFEKTKRTSLVRFVHL